MKIDETAPLCLPLDWEGASLALIGGKGAPLAKMAAAGLPVPPGFHITTEAYRRFVEANRLQAAVLDAATSATRDDLTSLERASESIRAAFGRGEMPAEIAEVIGRAYAELGEGERPVAVRSSATAAARPGGRDPGSASPGGAGG